MKQANNFRFQSKQRMYPSHFCRESYHSALAGNFFTRLTPQSTSLFSQGFVGTRVHCDNRHNQRRHSEVHAFLRALVLKAKIHPFFVPKDKLQNIPLRRCFQMENLISLSISLSQQNENKQREFELLPFWLVAVPTSPSRAQQIRAWLKHAHSFCRSVHSFLVGSEMVSFGSSS